MHSRKYHLDEEYDSENFAYINNDDDDAQPEEEFDFDEFDEDDENDEQMSPQDETEPSFDMMDISGGDKKLSPSSYDFEQIMRDYNSGDERKKEYAIEQALYAMDALVKHVINRHYPTYRDKYYDDMLQEGRLAVISTLGGYTGKCAPSSYFYTTIRHQIQVFVAEHVHRTTRHYAAMANKIRKAELALSQIDGKDHHDDLTISVYTGLPLTTVIETRKQTLAADFVELNANLDTDDLNTTDYGNPVNEYWKTAKSNAVNNALKRLLPIEAAVLRMMYGLDDGHPLNPPEIARRLHLKTEQVRKISQDACRKLTQDKKLKDEVNVQDSLTEAQNRLSASVPFVPVEFGAGVNFFDDLEEEEEMEVIDKIDNLEDILKPIDLKDE